MADDYSYGSQTKGQEHFKLQRKVQLKPWFQGLGLNGTEVKILTRLRTNHGLCGIKKFLFKLEPTWFCDVCKVLDTLEHGVLFCRKYQNTRRNFKIFDQCETLGKLLKGDMSVLRELVKFTKVANLVI